VTKTTAKASHDSDGRHPVHPFHSHDSPPDLLVFYPGFELDAFKFLRAALGAKPFHMSGGDSPFLSVEGGIWDWADASAVGDGEGLVCPGNLGADGAEREECVFEELGMVGFEIFVRSICTLFAYEVLLGAVILALAGMAYSAVGVVWLVAACRWCHEVHHDGLCDVGVGVGGGDEGWRRRRRYLKS